MYAYIQYEDILPSYTHVIIGKHISVLTICRFIYVWIRVIAYSYRRIPMHMYNTKIQHIFLHAHNQMFTLSTLKQQLRSSSAYVGERVYACMSKCIYGMKCGYALYYGYKLTGFSTISV